MQQADRILDLTDMLSYSFNSMFPVFIDTLYE